MFDLSKKVLHKKESKAMLMKWNRKLMKVCKKYESSF